MLPGVDADEMRAERSVLSAAKIFTQTAKC
jgi:hypothetical protein